jgi:hypothetical protein
MDARKLAYTLGEAAAAASVSEATLRRAIHTWDPSSFPPPLRAKRAGHGPNARYLVMREDLVAWLDSLPDG